MGGLTAQPSPYWRLGVSVVESSGMKIFMGVRSAAEIPTLLEHGAHEFYTGFNCAPDFQLRSQYPPYAALQSFEELEEAVQIVRGAGSKLFIALNALYYGQDDLAVLPAAAQKLVEIGVDGVIVASFPLLLALSRLQLDTEICLSTLQPVFSGPSLDFFKRLGIKRMVLPEQSDAAEAEAILRDPDIQTEAFTALINEHFHTESYCLFHHRNRLFYTVNDRKSFRFCGARPQVTRIEGPPDEALDRYVSSTYLHNRPYRINNFGNTYRLYHGGLDYLKVGSRRMDMEGKLAALGIATGCLEMLESGADEEAFIAGARALLADHGRNFTFRHNPYL